jgi:hypothetical protein
MPRTGRGREQPFRHEHHSALAAGVLDGTFGNIGTRLLQVSTDPGGDSASAT